MLRAVGGAVALADAILKLWNSRSFGSSPQVPEDFKYLTKQFGPSYPRMPDRHRPFSKSASSVDWMSARQLFDLSESSLNQADGIFGATLDQRLVAIQQIATTLIDTLQPQNTEMLYSKFGVH